MAALETNVKMFRKKIKRRVHCHFIDAGPHNIYQAYTVWVIIFAKNNVCWAHENHL